MKKRTVILITLIPVVLAVTALGFLLLIGRLSHKNSLMLEQKYKDDYQRSSALVDRCRLGVQRRIGEAVFDWDSPLSGPNRQVSRTTTGYRVNVIAHTAGGVVQSTCYLDDAGNILSVSARD